MCTRRIIVEPTYMTSLKINKVRHLHDIEIPLSGEERKHLILTGKNGSGKTSVLTALECFFALFSSDVSVNDITYVPEDGLNAVPALTSETELQKKFKNGEFVLACFSDSRRINMSVPRNIEKITLPKYYSINSEPGKDFAKYLVNLKTKQAFAQTQGKLEIAQEIQAWFDNFEAILRDIYEEDSLKLDFDIDTFQFNILIDGREPFDFNTMSMGYSAVFDIICDLMLRMEGKNYNLEGIVLIDEIETHLHVDLQKKIMPILTGLFPGLQFVLTTHSPFILSSLKNAVVYDLEKHLLVENGLTNLPYEGIVEGYFDTDTLSAELKEKFERYRQLAGKPEPSDEDYAEMTELEMYLDEVPDYLALDFATEYARLKLEVNS